LKAIDPDTLVSVDEAEALARNLRLLIVDDSRLQRRILMTALGGQGYDLAEAGSAAEAIEACRSELPDIVISDWIMPGTSGLELCAEIRQTFTDDYIYFIILTSKSAKEDLAEALRSGADDFLAKPLSGEELSARISAGERLLRMSRELRDKNRLITRTLEQMRAINVRLDKDLAEARRLQMSLAPKTAVRSDAWDISFLLQPSGHVGGDLVGTFPIAKDKMGLFSLDVSGHGIAAALITARLSSWLSGGSPDRNASLYWEGDTIRMHSPDYVCRQMNERFLTDHDTGHYFTMVIGELDLITGRFVFCQAGHPHPLLQTKNGDTRFIGSGGPPIGLIDGVEYEKSEVMIDPGDRLLICSDGITECPDRSGDLLDDDGLNALISNNFDVRGENLLAVIEGTLRQRIDDDDFSDDVSAVLIERQL